MNTPENFQGQGGSYVVNPETHEAELVERTQEIGEAPAAPAETQSTTEQE